jgi:hypothetical protein
MGKGYFTNISLFVDSIVNYCVNRKTRTNRKFIRIFIPIIQFVYVFISLIPLFMVGYPVWLGFFGLESVSDLLFIHFCLALFMNITLLINIKETHFSLPRLLIIIWMMLLRLKLHIRFIKLLGIIGCALIGFSVIYAFIPISFDRFSPNQQITILLIFLLAIVLAILEVRIDSIKRYSYQFLLWSILFILSFLFSVFQINDFLFVDNENIIISITVAIVGVFFNFAQVLSSGRKMFEAVYKVVEKEYKELIVNSVYKFDDLVASILDFSKKQKIFRYEVREQIRELGLKVTIIKFLPFLLGYSLLLVCFTLIYHVEEDIGGIVEKVLDLIGWVWVSLWAGNKKVATLMGLLVVVFYLFFNNLILLINTFNSTNFNLKLELASRVLVSFLLAFMLLMIVFNQ